MANLRAKLLHGGNSKFKYVHFRYPEIGRSAGVTVIITKEDIGMKGRANYAKALSRWCTAAISFCSPQEKSFDRYVGRSAAEKRLRHTRDRVSIPIAINGKDRTIVQMAEEVLFCIVKWEWDIVPQWFKDNFVLEDNQLVPVTML